MSINRFFCSKHNIIISESESLHHRDRGCLIAPYFGEPALEASDTDFERLSSFPLKVDIKPVKSSEESI
jgi:hypothetical protein